MTDEELAQLMRAAQAGDAVAYTRFRHSALGFVPDDYKEGLVQGWRPLLERVRKQAEAIRNLS